MHPRRLENFWIVVAAGCVLAACAHRPATDPAPGPSQPQTTAAAPAAPPASAAEVFDLGRDFSLSANPNGPWRYGYTRGTRLARAEVVPAKMSEPKGDVGFWHPASGASGYYPYVAGNLGASTARDATGSWAVRPGELALEASKVGQYAVVEFTVPTAGAYVIAADFSGIHKRLSTTDVHVLLNDDSVFSATIDGYGGDPALVPRKGASPTATYRATLTLRAGDVLTFAVGAGPDHKHLNDTTGVVVTIRGPG
jgi:hypothetical protein